MKSAVFVSTLLPAIGAAQLSQAETASGTLGILFSGAEYSLSLVVPSAALLGFEHPAVSEDDRTMVAVAISDLSKPLELFVVPSEAGCFTATANVTLSGDASELGGGASVQNENAQRSSEFQADYVIQCQDIEALNAMEFAYFERFENTEKLQVQLERAEGSHSVDVTRASPRLDLSGL